MCMIFSIKCNSVRNIGQFSSKLCTCGYHHVWLFQIIHNSKNNLANRYKGAFTLVRCDYTKAPRCNLHVTQ